MLKFSEEDSDDIMSAVESLPRAGLAPAVASLTTADDGTLSLDFATAMLVGEAINAAMIDQGDTSDTAVRVFALENLSNAMSVDLLARRAKEVLA